MNVFPRNLKPTIFFLMGFILNDPLIAMQVEPLLIEMGSSGSRSAATMTVINDGPNQLPIEIAMERLHLHLDKSPSTEPSDDAWLVFPPQVIIPPGGQQNFRLQWLGEPELAKSESFYLAVKQVPIEMPEGNSGIQLVYNIRALINVAPLNSTANLNVSSAEIIVDDEKIAKASLVFENTAARHAMLSNHDLSLTLIDKDGKRFWSRDLARGEIFQTIGVGLVQPDKQRRILLPLHLPKKAIEDGVRLVASVKASGS